MNINESCGDAKVFCGKVLANNERRAVARPSGGICHVYLRCILGLKLNRDGDNIRDPPQALNTSSLITLHGVDIISVASMSVHTHSCHVTQRHCNT
mmetsp:Transcript_1867/g.2687  ORF Transcript_1867/g.2687 Transcript_1867/m.2687 type:complete len:96 (+) Transcript_1867:79-366(+)